MQLPSILRGWATMPGGDPANSAVAQACAATLGSLDK